MAKGHPVGTEFLYVQFYNPADQTQSFQIFVTLTNTAGRFRVRSVSNVPNKTVSISAYNTSGGLIGTQSIPFGLWPGPTTSDTFLAPSTWTLDKVSLSGPDWLV